MLLRRLIFLMFAIVFFYFVIMNVNAETTGVCYVPSNSNRCSVGVEEGACENTLHGTSLGAGGTNDYPECKACCIIGDQGSLVSRTKCIEQTKLT